MPTGIEANSTKSCECSSGVRRKTQNTTYSRPRAYFHNSTIKFLHSYKAHEKKKKERQQIWKNKKGSFRLLYQTCEEGFLQQVSC